jgi:hypothetical protein
MAAGGFVVMPTGWSGDSSVKTSKQLLQALREGERRAILRHRTQNLHAYRLTA